MSGSSQLPVTVSLGNLMPSPGLHRHPHFCAYTHTGTQHTLIKNFKINWEAYFLRKNDYTLKQDNIYCHTVTFEEEYRKCTQQIATIRTGVINYNHNTVH